jgi:hypothetical protein
VSAPVDAVLLRRTEGLAVVEGTDRVVILDLDEPGEAPVVLDGSGRVIWQVLAFRGTLDDLVDRVAALYDEEPDAVRPGVVEFVGDLMARGLLLADQPR